nr:unnamed protein product [Spirometra erinaceieuropaei]
MAEEIKGYADCDEWKHFYAAIKTVYCPTAKGTVPHLSADRTTLLIEKLQIFQRWAEHFRGVLNRLSTTSDAATARLSQVETNTDLDLSKKPPGSCSGYAAGKRLDRTQLLLRSTDTAAPNS